MYQSAAEVFVNGFRAQRVDIHGSASNKVLNAPLYLWRTSSIVRTVVGSLARIAHQLGTTFRTMGNEGYWLCIGRTFVYLYAHYLRYNLAALLNIHIVGNV